MREHLSSSLILAALHTSICLGQTGVADQPAFSVAPVAMQKAFPDVQTGSSAVTVLVEDALYEYDAAGNQTYRHRLVFKVWTKEGADQWAMIERTWSPWRDDRPSVRARVITKDGSVHELDPKTIADSPVTNSDNEVVSDRKTIRAPLPALEPGAVVEQEVTVHQKKSPSDAGDLTYFYFGYSVPVDGTHLRIRVPASLPFRFKTELLPDLKVHETQEGGVHEVDFAQGPMKAAEPTPALLPPDVPRSPYVVFSTVKDWRAVAASYSAVVETQIKGFNAASYLPKFTVDANREKKIEAVVEKLNRDIRYTGIEFGEASFVPRTPSEVLQRKYGDCKDKATLAVALLRAAGIEAYVALLLSSTGEDVQPDMPGMDAFNHAIVYAPGNPNLWLDLTDPDLRIGVVSPANQGRLSLIARPETSSLLKTSELGPEENRIVETREFFLSELGRARVIETSEAFGTIDREYRGSLGGRTDKEMREDLKKYIETTYGESKLAKITTGDPEDLSKPFTLKIELEDAQRGTTVRTEAAVAIFVSSLPGRLPNYFLKDPKDETAEQKDKEKAAPRTQDFFIHEPFTYEWRYKVEAPAGFRIRQLPETKQESIGLASLSESFTRESDTQITAIFRFTMPTRHFSATEGAALRGAVVELVNRKPMLIYFDQIGETELASGQVKQALAEFDRLRKLHPKESLHSLQYARALLVAGAGESARAEARKAVALEPGSASAQIQLAEILKHDLVGRPMEKGFDRDAAAEAYGKALDLDPSDAVTRANRAILLEYDRSGVRYGAGARLGEAIVEYQKNLTKLADVGVLQNYPIALLQANRMEDLRDYLRKQPDNETNQTLLICAEAVLNGSKAAIARAGEVSGVSAKQRVLVSAGKTLIEIRRYELAADLIESGSAGAESPAAISNLIQVLRKTRRLEEVSAVTVSPEDAVRILLYRVATIEGHEKNWSESFSSLLLDDPSAELKGIKKELGFGRTQTNGLSAVVTADLTNSVLQFSHEGSDEAGYVVRVNAPAMETQEFLVVREQQNYRIIGCFRVFGAVAQLVLKLVDEGKLAQAATWLDRVRQKLPAGSGDDPLSGPLFSRLWQKNQSRDSQSANAASIRLAAVVLLIESGSGKASAYLSTLEASLTGADASTSNVLSAALAEGYFLAKAYGKALTIGKALMKSVPQSPAAFFIALRAAYASGGHPEGNSIANANISRFDQEAGVLRMVAGTAMIFGDTDRSREVTKQIIASGRAQTLDYNQLAWADLMAGTVTQASLDTANKGMSAGSNASTALMHTVAAVDAELGRESEARALLLQRMKLENDVEPNDDEWYVFGRIAEQYGLTTEAAALYNKLQKPRDEMFIPASSYALAQKRLKALASK
jgi:tetratricopeptide (TPR) repeat protein